MSMGGMGYAKEYVSYTSLAYSINDEANRRADTMLNDS